MGTCLPPSEAPPATTASAGRPAQPLGEVVSAPPASRRPTAGAANPAHFRLTGDPTTVRGPSPGCREGTPQARLDARLATSTPRSGAGRAPGRPSGRTASGPRSAPLGPPS